MWGCGWMDLLGTHLSGVMVMVMVMVRAEDWENVGRIGIKERHTERERERERERDTTQRVQ